MSVIEAVRAVKEPFAEGIERVEMEESARRQPRIIAFACHYCAFAAADLAGVMRLSYEPSVTIIRLPCTGKLDHSHVLRAFRRGVDGVFVAG